MSRDVLLDEAEASHVVASDDNVTLVPCLVCKGRGRDKFVPCASCVGVGMVTPDAQARQRLEWPRKAEGP